MTWPIVTCGADRLLGEERFLALVRGKRVGVVVNQTAVMSGDYSFWPARLKELTGAVLEVVFSPEHGLWGAEQDQVPCTGDNDTSLGAPVVSLYGADPGSLKPDSELLSRLDLVLFDIQDVGSRYYTYIYTMAYVMEAAAAAGVEFAVLDRANPLGGERCEGPVLGEGFESFVGRFAGVPVRHGMTAGELALYFCSMHSVGATPTVVPVTGWKRSLTAFDYSAPWVGPSPNMPTPDTALVYPGMCLLEGTNLSEGRGTTRPFETFGAPYLDAFALAGELNAMGLPGVIFRPLRFIPFFSKHSGALCSGAHIHVTDRHAFCPVLTGAAVIYISHLLAPAHFAWLEGGYEFVTDIPAIDLLWGGDSFRILIEAGAAFDEIRTETGRGMKQWMLEREGFLLYQ
ncbi:MAG: DUF1343 domain-containing protein [Gemmatimonadota bacterium]|nr:DUF1343 domain-containing protein [Gemmatimonadota bacterium]